MKRYRRPLSLALGLTVLPLEAAEPLTLESSVISASPLATHQQEMATPVAVLEGAALIQQREASIGETLEHLPGVRSSSFGAGVGRPVIRGQSGARIKILSDGVDVLDASSISPDHAVTTEPLLSRRIEVLKGPATLLYGSGAIGGVVNVLDQKVPTYVPAKGYEGTAEIRANTVAREGAGVFGLTAGHGPFALRFEGVKRQDDDYRVADNPHKEQGSFNDTDTFTLGGSLIGDRGYIGLAYTRQDNRYGLLAHQHADCHQDGSSWHCGAHEDEEEGHDEHGGGVPYVDLEQKRWDIRGELKDPLPGFEQVRFRMGRTRYEHKEMEEGAVATRFNNKAVDSRLELTHQPLLGWHGVLGGQSLRRDFEATGEEAYIPRTVTRNRALFILEEYTLGAWRYELGLRHEWQRIEADGVADKQHQGTSWSAATVWSFAPDYTLGLSYARSQRLPTAEELYSKGPHAATRTIELGNRHLNKETSHNLELSLHKLAGRTTFDLSLYRNTIDDYINPTDTGNDIGNGYREVEYRQADAIFTGVEGELHFAATEATTLSVFGDQVRARFRQGGGNLPRIPGMRLGGRVEHRFSSSLDGHLELYRVARQRHVARYESRTGGYTMLSAGLSYSDTLGQDRDYMVYLKGTNLLNEKWRNQVSYIKDEVIMPGRNVTLGLQVSF